MDDNENFPSATEAYKNALENKLRIEKEKEAQEQKEYEKRQKKIFRRCKELIRESMSNFGSKGESMSTHYFGIKLNDARLEIPEYITFFESKGYTIESKIGDDMYTFDSIEISFSPKKHGDYLEASFNSDDDQDEDR